MRAVRPQHTSRDLDHLRGSFSFRINHFWKSLAQGTVMIDFGEAEVFKRKLAQAADGVVQAEAASAHRFQKIANVALVHFACNFRRGEF